MIEADEIYIPLDHGWKLVFPSYDKNPSGVDYVRIVDAADSEQAYWTSSEWQEDPEGVMGAILGAAYLPESVAYAIRKKKPKLSTEVKP